MLREAPFEHLEWPREVRSEFMVRFHSLKNEIDPALRERFIQYERVAIEESFRRWFHERQPEPAAVSSADLDAARREMVDVLAAKDPQPMPYIVGARGLPAGVKVNQLIADAFKARGYRRAKDAPPLGVKTFSRVIDGTVVFAGLERGSLRSFMSLFIGLQKPLFLLDIGMFFGYGQSHFDYVYETESIGLVQGRPRRIFTKHDPVPQNVVDVTNRAIDCAERLLPHIVAKLKEKRLLPP